MSIRNLIMSAAGIVLLLHSLSALADEILIVGNEYKPPKIFMKDKEPSGILVDIMKYIDRHTEHSFDIQLYPWKRAYSMAEAGEAGIIGFSMTSERFELFDFSEVIHS